MYKHAYLLIAAVLLVMSYSCRKDKNPPIFIPPTEKEPEITDSIDYDLVWQMPIYPDTLVTHSELGLKIIQNNFLFLRNKEWAGKNDVLFLDGVTGEEKWLWDDFVNSKRLGLNGTFEDGNYYTSGDYEYYSIDMETGTTNWIHEMEDKTTIGGNIDMGDYIYSSTYHWSNFINQGEKISIVKIKKSTGDVFDVFSLKKEDDFWVSMAVPVVWFNEQGDTILVFQNRQYRSSPYRDKIDIYSYNMTQDSIFWMLEDYGDGVLSNGHKLVVDGDRIYYLNARTMHCIDKYTGETLWSKSYNTTFLCSNYFVVDDKVIYSSCEGHLVFLDKMTGEELYFKEDGAAIDHITYHDGRLYFVNGSLKIIDVNTGKKLYDIETPNKKYGNNFTGSVLINEELGYMYVHDYYFLMCMKIPE